MQRSLQRSAAVALAAVAVVTVAACRSSDGGASVGVSGATSPSAVATTAVPATSAPARAGAPAATAGHSTVATHAPSPRRPVATSVGDVLLDGGAVVLPDLTRTPGATNPAVTQATIHRTICLTGYTKTIRPPSSYTTGLKVQQLASGYAFQGDRNPSDYEEDHLISLELGGSPSSVRNLWPEPYAATDGARVKDRIENELHDLVCSGQLSLRAAQRAIATNWWSAYQRYGGTGAPHVYEGAYGGSSAGSSGAATSAGSTGGATAQCRDGSYSYSQHRSGTCSHHGGVDHWINPPPS